MLTARVLSEASHLCHAPQLKGRAPTHLCRGARDLQLEVFHRLGVISEPTDAGWKEAVERLRA